jgi:hypothetical protein
MPHIPVKFKSDKEIENEETGTEIKVRRHNPFDFENQYICDFCPNMIQPKCNLGVPYSKENAFLGCYPCVKDCSIVINEKRVGDLCDFYEEAKCKKGYPVSIEPMNCPEYDGPKPHVINLGWAVLINYGGKEKFVKNMRANKK